FNFAAANYSPPPHIFATTAEFDTYVAAHGDDMNGTFYITGGGQNDPVDISGIKVSGDLAIIATQAPITADSGSADVTSAPGSPPDKILVLVSFYAPPENVACATNGGNPGDCAIGIKNNFGPGDNTATLVYAPNGPVAFKNKGGSTPDFLGAIYASNIVLKNNQVVEYDSRVEQVVGFGPVTLERESWVEVSD
ncbi:MAG TPA: hypothetical protein VFX21_09090, partial [Acidimicrobiia bacterium]|nr:hypothetical protein [Acidimicrobiia bacterium]